VIDFRISVDRALAEIPTYELGQWIPESVFRSNTDVVSFTSIGKNDKVLNRKKGVMPDAYFILLDNERKSLREPYKIRFLLELDMSTHDSLRFGREKAAPGVAYIRSPEYKKRFSVNSGLWLVVTIGGQKRMENLMSQTEHQVGTNNRLFFFTQFDHLESNNALTSPIWFQVGMEHPAPLLSIRKTRLDVNPSK
jgi:hypothetical protein